jgi:hypothetical protein
MPRVGAFPVLQTEVYDYIRQIEKTFPAVSHQPRLRPVEGKAFAPFLGRML